MPRTRTLLTVAGFAIAVPLVLSACSDADTGTMDHSSMSSTSSTSSTASGSSSGSGTEVQDEHNDQDVTFAQEMTVHHQGAIEMSQMALATSDDQQIKDLATQVAAAQQPEIDEMTDWLQAWGEPPSTGGSMAGMDHSSTPMPGMMSQDQRTELQNATGTDFDRLFLQLMLEHHQGAVQMSETEQDAGSNPQALELAASIIATQNAEIDQMNQMLAAMG